MHDYPSYISREQFEIIRSDLEAVKKKTRPRKYDLYDIVRFFTSCVEVTNAKIFRVGIWFTSQSKADENGVSLLDKKLVEGLRFASERNFQTAFGIIDSKSIKNIDTAQKTMTQVKKISGIKLHLAVDISGYSGFANTSRLLRS